MIVRIVSVVPEFPLWVPRIHPPSSGDHPVLVDETAHAVGSS
jgi:hypothetical protein